MFTTCCFEPDAGNHKLQKSADDRHWFSSMGNRVKQACCRCASKKTDNLPFFQTNPGDIPENPIELNQCQMITDTLYFFEWSCFELFSDE